MNALICKYLLLALALGTRLLAGHHEHLSAFEQKAVDQALVKNSLLIDKNPENKKIRGFYFFTEGPFDKSNKLFSWAKNLQFTSTDKTLQSQLWIEAGDTFNESILIQNEQALLDPTIRDFVLIFPVQSVSTPSLTEVDILVVTKEIIDWQLTWAITGSSANISSFSLSLAQTNLLGLNKTVGVSFGLDPALFNLSAEYNDPNLFYTKNRLSVEQGVFLGRGKEASGYEGLFGSLSLSYPLIIESTQWGYNLNFNYNLQPVYQFQGAEIRKFEGIERKYRQTQFIPSLTITRSFGSTYKSNLSFGYGVNYAKYESIGEVTPSFTQKVIPISETQSYFILGYNYFQNKFFALYDYNTFAMTEWYQLGPSINLTNNFALSALGSTWSFYRPNASARWAFKLGRDSALTFNVSGSTRIQNRVINNQFSGSLKLIAPSFGKVGRFVAFATAGSIWDNQNNTQWTAGSDVGLRGVPFQYYQGNNFIRSNLEFRTTSLPWWILRLGLVGFYDFGTAFDELGRSNPTHNIGAGVRIFTVPWNRVLIRIDVAVPVAGPLKGFEHTLVSFGLGQAF